MPAILFLMVGGVMVFVLFLLAVVVVGIRLEPSAEELKSQAPSAITAWVRRLLGVYVRKPEQPSLLNENREEPCPTPRPSARWPKGPAA